MRILDHGEKDQKDQEQDPAARQEWPLPEGGQEVKTKVYHRIDTFLAENRKIWSWTNFKPSEIACKDGSIMVDTEAMDALQALRNVIGAPLILNSAYRSPAYNTRVGGAPRSYHMQAMAFDIQIAGHDPHEIERAARECGFRGIGRYPTFIHVDTGPEREWGDLWPYGEDEPAAPAAPARSVADLPASLVKLAGCLKAKQRAAASLPA